MRERGEYLAKRHPRPLSVHACRDVHGRKLLEQKFGRIRNVDLRDLVLILAGSTFVIALLEFAVMQ